MIEDKGIFEPLQPLIKQARAEGKWLHSVYQNLWFTPAELEDHHRQGRFRWGDMKNWSIRDPQELLAKKAAAIGRLQDEYVDVCSRMKEG